MNDRSDNIYSVFLFYMLGCLVGCSSITRGENPKAICPPDVRDRWITAYNQAEPTVGPIWGGKNVVLGQLMDQYYEAVVGRSRQIGKIHLVFVDENGKPLEGVRAGIRRATRPSVLIPPALGPNMSLEITTVEKDFDVRWSRDVFSIEVGLSKKGYRQITVGFDGTEDRVRLHTAYMLEHGFVLPPATPNGPIRIVMPPDLLWEPRRYPNDVSGTGWVYREIWPKKIPESTKVVVSSKNPREIAVEERGTYVLTDRNGRIIDMRQLDRGNLLGILSFTTDGGEKILNESTGGSSSKIPLDGEPYEWRLYSVPKPVERN